MSSSPFFQPSCPAGGRWYACGNGAKFVGCCASDPCNDNGCARGNLYPASFNPSFWGDFPDQGCSAGLWYTCSTISPTFMGCCKSNPCSPDGCPSEDLAAGQLLNSSTAQKYDPYPPIDSDDASSATTQTTTGSRSTSTTLSTTTTTAQASSTQTPALLPSPQQAPNIKAIIGGSVGGGVVLIIMALILLYWRHTRRSRDDFRASSRLFQPSTQHEKSTNSTDKVNGVAWARKVPNFHEAPDSQLSPSPAFPSPAPRYTARGGPVYHEVPTDDRTIRHFANPWSPHTPPGSPERYPTGYAPIVPSSAYNDTQQYGVSPIRQKDLASPLEYDSSRNAWMNHRVGLDLGASNAHGPTYPRNHEGENRWPEDRYGYR